MTPLDSVEKGSDSAVVPDIDIKSTGMEEFKEIDITAFCSDMERQGVLVIPNSRIGSCFQEKSGDVELSGFGSLPEGSLAGRVLCIEETGILLEDLPDLVLIAFANGQVDILGDKQVAEGKSQCQAKYIFHWFNCLFNLKLNEPQKYTE
jgi:hypothetical protein